MIHSVVEDDDEKGKSHATNMCMTMRREVGERKRREEGMVKPGKSKQSETSETAVVP